ncbi:MAG TPA: DUF3618 domain-containing protein [Pyrinomonadaceae bacterium]|jgi:hypothetical protein
MAGKKTEDEPTKAELQRQMEQTRESISETVEEIKETVSHQYDVVKDTYETVKEGVGEVLDWREQFSKNPIVWGAGAVSLGILVGIGLAHSMGSVPASDRRRKSKQGALNESLLSNLSGLSETLLPTMTSKIKEMFGIDLNAYLPAPAETASRPPRMIGSRRPTTKKKNAASKSAAKKSRARKGSAK